MVSFPTSGAFSGYINSLFGSFPLSEQQAIWDEFINANNFTTANPPDPTSLTDQAKFLAFSQNITASVVPFPTSGVYKTYIRSFFGNLGPFEQQALWNQFISLNGYTAANPPQETSITDQEKFIQFSESTVLSNQTLNLSLDEVKQRAIMFATFDVLLQMLTTMQNTISTEGNNLVFLGKWQEQYTNAMARVPTYVGGTSSTPNIPAIVNQGSLSQFTFGYDGISVQDIVNTMANFQTKKQAYSVIIGNMPTTDTTVLSSITGTTTPPTPIPADAQLAIQFTTDANGVGFIKLTTVSTGDEVSIQVPPSTSTNVQTALAQNATNFANAFVAFWRGDGTQNLVPHHEFFGGRFDNRNAGAVISGHQVFDHISFDQAMPTIPWTRTFVYSGTDTTLQNAAQTQSKARAEVNARDQQFIQNLTGYRSIIQNVAQQVQSNLSTSKDAISNLANTLDNIITSLQSLIASVFK